MANDHVVAFVGEGDLAIVAAGLEDHAYRDDEPPHLGDPTMGAGQGRGAGQHEHDVGAHRSPDHRVVSATERGEELPANRASRSEASVSSLGISPHRPSEGGA